VQTDKIILSIKLLNNRIKIVDELSHVNIIACNQTPFTKSNQNLNNRRLGLIKQLDIIYQHHKWNS